MKKEKKNIYLLCGFCSMDLFEFVSFCFCLFFPFLSSIFFFLVFLCTRTALMFMDATNNFNCEIPTNCNKNNKLPVSVSLYVCVWAYGLVYVCVLLLIYYKHILASFFVCVNLLLLQLCCFLGFLCIVSSSVQLNNFRGCFYNICVIFAFICTLLVLLARLFQLWQRKFCQFNAVKYEFYLHAFLAFTCFTAGCVTVSLDMLSYSIATVCIYGLNWHIVAVNLFQIHFFFQSLFFSPSFFIQFFAFLAFCFYAFDGYLGYRSYRLCDAQTQTQPQPV